VGAWQQGVIYDEDEFVATIDDALEQEEVQTALAQRLTDTLMEELGISERVEATLTRPGASRFTLKDGLILEEESTSTRPHFATRSASSSPGASKTMLVPSGSRREQRLNRPSEVIKYQTRSVDFRAEALEF
jgi:hypothetical protein